MDKQTSGRSLSKTQPSANVEHSRNFRTDQRTTSQARIVRKLYDPIPKPTAELGFRGIRHKTNFDSMDQRDRGN